VDNGETDRTRYADRTSYANRRGGDRRTRWLTALGVAVLHVAAILALIKGLTAAGVIEDPLAGTEAYQVALPPRPPEPSPTPSETGDEAAGKAAPEAPRAKPREAAAPKPKLPLRRNPAPPSSGTGSANASGAGAAGAGSGGGGSGEGTGSGGSGSGQGSGAARPAEKIAGEINSIRDYPKAGRDARIGRAVIIAMTIGTDGRAHGCRVVSSSGDPEADRITCRLAEQRFRFRPRLDGQGRPVEAQYQWRQRFFVP
jgi:protein TonB